MRPCSAAIAVLIAISLIFTACSIFDSRDTGIETETVTESKEDEETGTGQKEDEDKAEGDGRQETLGEEYFVSAILKSIDILENKIMVEQLINDPDETIIQPEVELAEDYEVVRSELDIEEGEEKYTDITLEDIPIQSEIGILFDENDRAQLIIHQVLQDISQEEIINNTVLGFLEAVEDDREYEYFSSHTVDEVGTYQQYINGDKSDIYFIIQESHSGWEDVEVTSINIEGDRAEVELTGDRTVEGMEYEDDTVTFRLSREQGTWKMDFSY